MEGRGGNGRDVMGWRAGEEHRRTDRSGAFQTILEHPEGFGFGHRNSQDSARRVGHRVKQGRSRGESIERAHGYMCVGLGGCVVMCGRGSNRTM